MNIYHPTDQLFEPMEKKVINCYSIPCILKEFEGSTRYKYSDIGAMRHILTVVVTHIFKGHCFDFGSSKDTFLDEVFLMYGESCSVMNIEGLEKLMHDLQKFDHGHNHEHSHGDHNHGHSHDYRHSHDDKHNHECHLPHCRSKQSVETDHEHHTAHRNHDHDHSKENQRLEDFSGIPNNSHDRTVSEDYRQLIHVHKHDDDHEHNHNSHEHNHDDHEHNHDDHEHNHDDHEHNHDDHEHNHADHEHHDDHEHNHTDHGHNLSDHNHTNYLNVHDSHNDTPSFTENYDHGDHKHDAHDSQIQLNYALHGRENLPDNYNYDNITIKSNVVYQEFNESNASYNKDYNHEHRNNEHNKYQHEDYEHNGQEHDDDGKHNSSIFKGVSGSTDNTSAGNHVQSSDKSKHSFAEINAKILNHTILYNQSHSMDFNGSYNDNGSEHSHNKNVQNVEKLGSMDKEKKLESQISLNRSIIEDEKRNFENYEFNKKSNTTGHTNLKRFMTLPFQSDKYKLSYQDDGYNDTQNIPEVHGHDSHDYDDFDHHNQHSHKLHNRDNVNSGNRHNSENIAKNVDSVPHVYNPGKGMFPPQTNYSNLSSEAIPENDELVENVSASVEVRNLKHLASLPVQSENISDHVISPDSNTNLTYFGELTDKESIALSLKSELFHHEGNKNGRNVVLIDSNPKVSWNKRVDKKYMQKSQVEREGGFHDLSNEASYRSYLSKCLSMEELTEMFGSVSNSSLTKTDFLMICPALIQQIVSGVCQKPIVHQRSTPTQWEVYIYSIGSSIVISLSSLAGVFLLPILTKRAYNYVMAGFMGLAFSTLAGDAIFHLIPQALGIHSHDSDDLAHDHNHETDFYDPNLWKLVGIFFSMYMLYLFEAILGCFSKSSHHSHDGGPDGYVPNAKDLALATIKVQSESCAQLAISPEQSASSLDTEVAENDAIKKPEPAMHSITSCCGLASVAWLVILGDSIHNFGDGLALGAAYSSDIRTGLSTSIAIFCHELPHEFGDFIILISTGLSFSKAMAYNFLSGLLCVIGSFVGIVIGYNDTIRSWIMVVAAGMFLYIALAEMLPALKRNKKGDPVKILLATNFGIIVGMSAMILISLFEHKFHF